MLLSSTTGLAIFNEYGFIILLSLIIILSYFFNQLAKKTNIPSVILLIVTGVGLQIANSRLHLINTDLFPVLQVLGIVGLIMIVLEAALDLELRKDKIGLILKSLGVALISLLGTSALIMLVLEYSIEGISRPLALVYAIPLAVMSSAIIIPSVGNLEAHKREFMIYESTFSDILGIMLFYFCLELAGGAGLNEQTYTFLGSLTLTIVLAVVLSYLLVILFQSLNSPVKLFVLIAMLMLLYSVGKLFHLSPLFIILIFGLVLANPKIFFRGFLRKSVNMDRVHQVESEFTVLTMETAFLVRTLFFVMFGFTLTLSALTGLEVWLDSALIIATIYLVRLPVLKLFNFKERLQPQVWLAPRGLITILLLFSIPGEMQLESFNQGILLIVIIVTSLIMTFALISEGTRTITAKDPESAALAEVGKMETEAKQGAIDGPVEGQTNEPGGPDASDAEGADDTDGADDADSQPDISGQHMDH